MFASKRKNFQKLTGVQNGESLVSNTKVSIRGENPKSIRMMPVITATYHSYLSWVGKH